METLQLIDGVVQLRIGVAQLLAVHEELETLGQIGVVAVTLAQRRHLARIVAHEGGLYKLVFAVLSEDGVYEFAFAHRRVGLDAQTRAGLADLLLAPARNVVTRLLADGVGHRDAAERRLERYLAVADGQLRGAVGGHRHVLQHLLGELHHPLVVLVGHVYLHAGELGVVGAVHALVAEVLAELVHAVEAAHDQTLEIELAGDSHVEIYVERVVVRDERTRRRAARDGLQDGSLHLHVTARVEELAHGSHDLGALHEDLAHLRIHGQIDVTLAVAHFGVGQGVELLAVLLLHDGQGSDRLRYDGQVAAVNRLLARVGDEREALHAHEVAYVEQLLEYRVVERRIAFGADVVAAYVDLNAARVVLQFEERRAAHYSAAHDSARDAHLGEFVGRLGREALGYRGRRGRNIVSGCGIRIYSQFAQGAERSAAQLFLFAEF